MSTAQRLGVGLFYAAMAVLGAAYAVFEHHQASRLAHFIKDVMPAFLILILVFVVYALFRTVVSVLKELNGVSRAAHATLHADYAKK
jgi:mannose/fructose/N-acetylgalactosamine-specific phosphotransferase system component IID